MGSVSLNSTKLIAQTETNGIQFHEDEYTAERWMPAHEHPQSHLVLCVGGVIEQHSGKESFLVTEKSVAYVPAYETHSNMFRGIVSTFQITIDETSFGISQGESKGKSLHQHHHSASLMHSIYREFKSPDKYSPLMLHSLAMEVFVSIHREEEVPCASNCRVPWLLQVRDLLHDELAETLQLEGIAAKVGVHPAHMTRAFRQQFGQSIGEYVRGLRISRARHLLESSDLSIGAVALATGFVDQSHFTRTFKVQTGRTPRSYRAKH
jgi:AraC family transcriptional regulator